MWLIIILIVLILIFIIICSYEMTHYKITHYTIKTDKPVDSQREQLRIVLITDLHGRSYKQGNNGPIADIIKEKPDMIVIAGDMLVGNTTEYNDCAADFVCRLAGEFPVYYSYGNHEERQHLSYNTQFEEYKAKLINAGVVFLDNSIASPAVFEGVKIYGLSLPIYSYNRHVDYFSAKNYLSHKLGEPDTHTLNILLAHDPYHFDGYVKWGADIVLSGHVHGGIIRLPLFGGVISPRFELFPKYDFGLFSKKSCTMLISRGLGNHSLPVRVFNLPEIIVLDITTNKGANP